MIYSIKSGDTIVLTYAGTLSDDAATRLKARLTEALGHEVKVLILGEGASISVIQRDA